MDLSAAASDKWSAAGRDVRTDLCVCALGLGRRFFFLLPLIFTSLPAPSAFCALAVLHCDITWKHYCFVPKHVLTLCIFYWVYDILQIQINSLNEEIIKTNIHTMLCNSSNTCCLLVFLILTVFLYGFKSLSKINVLLMVSFLFGLHLTGSGSVGDRERPSRRKTLSSSQLNQGCFSKTGH